MVRKHSSASSHNLNKMILIKNTMPVFIFSRCRQTDEPN